MKKDLFLWQFGGFVFTVVLGTILHFLYDLTNQSVLVAPFSAINESTFEHMKLMYFPMLIFSLIQSRFFKEYKSFWCVKLIGILTGLALIPALFYTYNGAFGKSPDFINIAIFFIAAALAFLLEEYLLRNEKLNSCFSASAFLVILLIGGLFVLFTFAPQQLPIFKDPTI